LNHFSDKQAQIWHDKSEIIPIRRVETLKKALLVVDYMYDFGANDGKLKW